MKVSDKIILDLCGGTGAWSADYVRAGYDVRNITLPKYDIRTYEPPRGVYGILAAPPCTQFSLARAGTKKPYLFREGMELVIACLRIIWECRYNSPLKFWALENPRGFLRQFLGKPALTFCAYEYGDLWIKPTDLWGYFNSPRKRFQRDDFLKGLIDPNRITITISNMTSFKKASEIRAITPPGFARAFFEANK